MDMTSKQEIEALGKVPITVHWELPSSVFLRALVGEAQVEIDLTPEQARGLAGLLNQAADRLDRYMCR